MYLEKVTCGNNCTNQRESDMSKQLQDVIGSVSPFLLRQQNNKGFIDRAQISMETVEGVQGIKEGMLSEVPEFFEESWSKTIRPRASIVVQGEDRITELRLGEGANKGGSLSRVQGGGADEREKVQAVRGKARFAKEFTEKTVNDVGFSIMRKSWVPIPIIENLKLILQ
jgi:hypothetical protein